MSGAEGQAGVVAEAVKGVSEEIARAAGAAAGEQLGMFEIPTRFDGEKADDQRRKTGGSRQGAGRPPGSTNLATREMREYLLRRGVNPLEAMMRWGMHTPETLAKELSCTKLEAFDRLSRLWNDLGLFLFGRAAPTDAHGQAVPFLQMFLGGQALAAGALQQPPWMLDAEVASAVERDKRNQGVSEDAQEVSHTDSRTDKPSG